MIYEEILQEMLERVPSNVDKREGSIVYDALAPCAYFLAQQQFQLENFIDLVFADTAVGEYLDRVTNAYGVVRKKATAAVRQMVASDDIALGTRWAINNLVYVVTEELGAHVYEATCEVTGEIGNQYSGSLEPLSNVAGITANLTEIISAGADEESDEALRERYLTKVRLPATSGNAYHYQQWALEVAGVGAAKVFPLDEGPGTVTILVVDDNKEISATLPKTVAAYIETVRPIGATVSVQSPEALEINATAKILLDGTRNIVQVKEAFEASVEALLKDTVFESYRLSYAKIGSLLLDIPGVEDFEDFLLNGAIGNIQVGKKQIPVVGSIVLTEVSALAAD